MGYRMNGDSLNTIKQAEKKALEQIENAKIRNRTAHLVLMLL